MTESQQENVKRINGRGVVFYGPVEVELPDKPDEPDFSWLNARASAEKREVGDSAW